MTEKISYSLNTKINGWIVVDVLRSLKSRFKVKTSEHEHSDAIINYFKRVAVSDPDTSVLDGSAPEYAQPLVSEILKDQNNKPVSLLDIGCGSGQVLLALSNTLNVQHGRVSIEGIRTLSDKNVSLRRHKLEDFRAEERKYDLILSVNALSYIKDSSIFFEKCHNSIKYDGLLYIMEPIDGIYWERIFEGVAPYFRKHSRILSKAKNSSFTHVRTSKVYLFKCFGLYIWPVSNIIVLRQGSEPLSN